MKLTSDEENRKAIEKAQTREEEIHDPKENS